MSASGITITINGESVDLRDASWYQLAPCGCYSGVTTAWLPAPYSLCAATAEQAAEKLYSSTAEREQDERRGFTIVPGLRSEVVERMKDCPHTPKWGYERPRPEGMEWAVSSYGKGRRLHLVPVERERFNEATALCGGKRLTGWDSRWNIGKADCEKCIKKAVALRDSAVPS